MRETGRGWLGHHGRRKFGQARRTAVLDEPGDRVGQRSRTLRSGGVARQLRGRGQQQLLRGRRRGRSLLNDRAEILYRRQARKLGRIQGVGRVSRRIGAQHHGGHGERGGREAGGQFRDVRHGCSQSEFVGGYGANLGQGRADNRGSGLSTPPVGGSDAIGAMAPAGGAITGATTGAGEIGNGKFAGARLIKLPGIPT